jgi:hypothetical protein
MTPIDSKNTPRVSCRYLKSSDFAEALEKQLVKGLQILGL